MDEAALERPGRRRQVGKLSRPWIKRQLCRDLAISELNQSQLAVKYDCVPSAITEFKKRNTAEINAIRDDLENEFAGLWAANKANRIKVLEDQLEHVANRIGSGAEDEAGLLRVSQRAIMLIDEVLVHLTARIAVQADVTATVNYQVMGSEDV